VRFSRAVWGWESLGNVDLEELGGCPGEEWIARGGHCAAEEELCDDRRAVRRRGRTGGRVASHASIDEIISNPYELLVRQFHELIPAEVKVGGEGTEPRRSLV
jgi:hypothetical protein